MMVATPNPYWQNGGGGVLDPVKIMTYVGDAANNREIDLGDDYDYITVRRVSAVTSGTTAYEAWVIGTAYGIMSAANVNIGTNAAPQFQGPMSGADANKIKLGTNGANTGGVNQSGITYQVMGMKFSSILT